MRSSSKIEMPRFRPRGYLINEFPFARTLIVNYSILSHPEKQISLYENADFILNLCFHISRRAESILKSHASEHLRLAEALIKYETLEAEDVDVIAKGQLLVKTELEEKKKRKESSDAGGSGGAATDDDDDDPRLGHLL